MERQAAVMCANTRSYCQKGLDMKGPSQLVRSGKLAGCSPLECLFEWAEGAAYLTIDRVSYRNKTGAVLCYFNPPVHQMGNRELDAYLQSLDRLIANPPGIKFLVLCGANDPVHAGGDLRETLNNLDRTAKLKKERQAQGATPEEIDGLYDWADSRIKKGGRVHELVRKVSGFARTVSVCGGGTRFGGSAEIPLTADFMVADSRSGLCFSEAMLGIIPGWSGVARMLVKGGPRNAAYMAKLGREIKAAGLKEIGVFNEVVNVPLAFPRRGKTDDPEADRVAYQKALDAHDEETGLLLLPRALEMATCPLDMIPSVAEGDRRDLGQGEDVAAEVERRTNPENYSHLWGKPLRDVQQEIARLGRPLAPQSIKALNELLAGYDPRSFDERSFVEEEMEADARLYRDPRYRVGVVAALEQTVADFREREAS